ncbi:dynein light chain Tctex-type protein 2 isoform X2 [Oenanthe melanoleuca]|uniref:dynein light chain Tctex-type protein 2 isoform X2 n=1 Tax=Oenanthe melanoleuca TaxID=2939378 RepID=UPI0024C1520A|nr:dynein light chain Tctex-type protein 2 isoform X2 [Oenanthe melanoleuca]
MEAGKKRPEKDTSKGKKAYQDASDPSPTEEEKEKLKYSHNTYRLEPRTKVQDGLIRDKAQAILTVFFHIQQLNLFVVILKLLCSLWVVVSQVTIQGAAVILPNSLKVVAFMCSVASRCLWDVQRDTWVSAKCETDTFIALALVMACYYD